MDLSFANPAGFWALLALPVVLGIHFFQRQSRQVVTSTLFLFDALNPVSAQGRRIERLRHSLPLWLQLAAVVLLALLLAGPRFLRRDSSQRVVVVLDSSVSMGAFHAELGRALPAHLRALTRAAAKTEWHLLETDPSRPTLYAGTELTGLLAALDGWTPHLGTHDFTPALDAARGLAREAGTTIFVTDRRTEVPGGVEMLAVGHPLDNCGWVGVTVGGDRWRALVQNHAASVQTRTWHLEADGVAGAETSLTLAPGQIRTLGGAFLAGKNRCALVLRGDDFALDDRLPMVRPEPKRAAMSIQGEPSWDALLRRIAGSVTDADIVDEPTRADVRLVVRPLSSVAPPPQGHAIVFLAAADSSINLAGEPLAENHPLTAGLVWNGLLCRQTDPIPSKEGDEALVWQGDRPLIFLRGGWAERSLYVNFDVRQSNADRLPAFVVLLDRFVESVRAQKVAFERRNAETNQSLEVAGDPTGPPPVLSNADATLRAPFAPGFFEVRQGERTLLEGAAHFADAREADFKAASTFDTLEGKSSRMRARNSRDDFLWPVLALLLGALLLANWAAPGRGGRAAPAGLAAAGGGQ